MNYKGKDQDTADMGEKETENEYIMNTFMSKIEYFDITISRKTQIIKTDTEYIQI